MFSCPQWRLGTRWHRSGGHGVLCCYCSGLCIVRACAGIVEGGEHVSAEGSGPGLRSAYGWGERQGALFPEISTPAMRAGTAL